MPIYHVWFATKRRRWLLQGDVADAAKSLIGDIANEKGLSLLESEAIVDHVHLLLECEDKTALSSAMNLIKGVSSRRLGLMFPEFHMDAGTNRIWQERFGSKIVPDSAMSSTKRYIRTQWDRLESYDRPNRLKA